jgi:aspartyl protease family protein
MAVWIASFFLMTDTPIRTAIVRAARVKLRLVNAHIAMVRYVGGVMPEGALSGSLLGMSFLGRSSALGLKTAFFT